MNFENALILSEDLIQKHIKYNNFKHDPAPKLLVLDNDYKNNCILAFNLNYFEKSSEAKKKLNDIYNLAKKSKLNKLDIYKEIKKKFPESIKYIRTYKKNKIGGF